ncbi:hypothetical protein LCGC14_2152810, partial [marine sediment metagenome]
MPPKSEINLLLDLKDNASKELESFSSKAKSQFKTIATSFAVVGAAAIAAGAAIFRIAKKAADVG